MKHNFFSLCTLFFKVLWFKWSILRDRLIEWTAVNILFPIAGLIQRKSRGQVQIQSLMQMPEHSFGKTLGLHMQQHKLEFIPGFEEHDMKHLLLGFPVTVAGEMLLSAFEFGAGNRSFMTMAVFIPALFLAPELWSLLKAEYQRGKRNRHMRSVHLKSKLDWPLEEVQTLLNVT